MAINQRATDEATLQEWHRRHVAGESWESIAADYGLAKGRTVRKRYDRWIRSGAHPPVTQERAEYEQQQTEVIFPDLKVRADEEIFCDRYIDLIIEQQALESSRDNEQDTAHVEIKDTRPIGVVFTGDWHLGNTHTDHALLKEYLALLRETDGLYACGMGDYCDYFIGRMVRLAVTEQQFKPAQQRTLARDLLLRKTGNKLLSVLAGNHCWKPEELTGEDPVADIAADAKVPYLGYGGTTYITLNTVQYKVGTWHSYPGGSALNPGNNNRRLRNDYEGLDVNCLAHYHYTYEQSATTRDGRDYVDLRSGSLKVRDARYAAMRMGVKSGDPRMPMVILFPDTKKVWHIRDFREWLPLLKWLREGNV